MPKFDEGDLCFAFGDRWQAEKWDTCGTYARGIGRLSGELDAGGTPRPEGTKAVDFVGVLDGEKLYFFEVKDFRGHRIENRARQLRELPLEIGLKVRDTIAGLVGAYVKQGGPPWVERCGRALAERHHQLHVVVWIADDAVRPNEPLGKRAARDSTRLQQIKQKLAWVTPRVWVEDPLRQDVVPDILVENLPGAGRP
ncbi:MAG TPA: hypothetical protein VFS00_06090 [Polyangiaceae bacterium]|nr:hypothetical protein [Polyangiaceae bacterium]